MARAKLYNRPMPEQSTEQEVGLAVPAKHAAPNKACNRRIAEAGGSVAQNGEKQLSLRTGTGEAEVHADQGLSDDRVRLACMAPKCLQRSFMPRFKGVPQSKENKAVVREHGGHGRNLSAARTLRASCGCNCGAGNMATQGPRQRVRQETRRHD